MPSTWEKLLATKLFRGAGSSDTATGKDAFAGKKYVGIYFSASWCGPCKKFTPRFATTYKNIAARDADLFEGLFVSADEDQDDFNEYRKEHPWPALDPVDENTLSDELRRDYFCSGFPTLVIVDATNGHVIAADAVQDVASDPEGASVPWRAMTLAEILDDATPLVGDEHITGAKSIGELRTDKGVREVALYFSAHWCPPCRQFTPKLAACYKHFKDAGRTDLEFIFVSSDEKAAEAASYHSTMGFAMLPHGDRRAAQLKKVLGVRGIPTCVTLRLPAKTGDAVEIISTKAVAAIHQNPEGFPWIPAPAPAVVTFRPARDVFEYFEGPIAVLDVRPAATEAEAAAMAAALEAEVVKAKAAGAPLPWQAMVLPKEDAIVLAPGCCPQGCAMDNVPARGQAGCDVCSTPVAETGKSCALHDFDMCAECLAANKSPSAPGAGLFAQIMGHCKTEVDTAAPRLYVIAGLATGPSVPKSAPVATPDAEGIAGAVKACQ